MTDDPFLPKQPPTPSDAVPTQVPPPPLTPVTPPSGAPEYYQPAPQIPPPPPVYAQPGIQPQPGQYPVPYAPYPPTAYAQQTKPKTWMNWVAFGCGLGALFTCVSFIPAIIFGHLGLAAAKRGEADAKGPGIAGLVIGYVFLAGVVAYITFFAIFFAAAPSSGY